MHITVENEKKYFSQSGEDGIIECIFDNIGTTNKIAVEIGVTAGNDIETNTSNLCINKKWKCYWFDIIKIQNKHKNCTFVKGAVTKKNVLNIFKKLKIPKEFDLLSIDIDGNDYHIREKLSVYNPRVVIMEYNGCFDHKTEYIMPYNEHYVWSGQHMRDFGASLLSYTLQAERMGYDLVYCTENGVNAFFIRKDINVFDKKTTKEVYKKLVWA